jgi:RNA polymerase sigma-70 factor (ECF subfamily)
VNSALQRARATLADSAPSEDELTDPDDPSVRSTVDRYVRAFEGADVATLVGLLTADVILEMPPVPLWYRGAQDYGRFIARVFAMRGTGWRMLPLRANGQPALSAYAPEADGSLRLHTLQVLTVSEGGISRNVVFQDPQVFTAFDLSPRLDLAS